MRACKGLYGDHIAGFNGMNHCACFGVDVYTLVDMILTLDTEGSRMLANWAFRSSSPKVLPKGLRILREGYEHIGEGTVPHT